MQQIRLDTKPLQPEPLLPKELWMVYAVAPFVATLLVVNGFWSLSIGEQLRKIAGVMIPFIVLTGVLYPSYVSFMPRLHSLVTNRALRACIHVAFVTLVALVFGTLVLPLHTAICGSQVPEPEFLITCVLISYLMVFPAMVVQAQRNRAVVAERQVVSERQAALKAQLEALQARTNPHFFFNSINVVASLIHENPTLAERTLERLAELFRYALESSKVSRVTMAREFEVARDFLDIQQARFESQLNIKMEISNEAAQVMVPPLILQPLVENAVAHGLGFRKRGTITVTARCEKQHIGNVLILEVTDDGPGPGASAHQGTKSSVKELGQRLKLAFGEAAALVLQTAPGGGCRAQIALPVPGNTALS
jgi:two-component system, LytTR family, sensor histidine kinase AlgZ